VAEQLNRTLTTKIRVMLAEAGLPPWLWGEAAYAACYLHNRTPRHYDSNRGCDAKGDVDWKEIRSQPSQGFRLCGVRTARPGATKERARPDVNSRDIRRLYAYHSPIPCIQPRGRRGGTVFDGPFRRKEKRWNSARPGRERTSLDRGRGYSGQHTAGQRHHRGESTIAGAAGGPLETDAVSVAATVTITIATNATRAHARRRRSTMASDPQWGKCHITSEIRRIPNATKTFPESAWK